MTANTCNWKPDQRSFELGEHIGEIKAWCEAAASDVKKMSLSAMFSPHEYDILLPYMKQISERTGVSFWLDKDFQPTDLFGDVDIGDNWVFIIYKHQSILDDYLKLKQDLAELEQTDQYRGQPRKDIAWKLGKLLGYSDQVLTNKLS